MNSYWRMGQGAYLQGCAPCLLGVIEVCLGQGFWLFLSFFRHLRPECAKEALSLRDA